MRVEYNAEIGQYPHIWKFSELNECSSLTSWLPSIDVINSVPTRFQLNQMTVEQSD